MPPPTVSVLIPTYNRERHIAACLRSAQTQTYPDMEIVVTDNASTDRTWDIVTAAAQHDPRIRAFRNPANLGPVRNWARGLDEARGTFAKFLWSDDAITPDYLEKTLPWLQNDPGVGFVCTGIEIVEEPQQTRTPAYFIGPTGVYATRAYREGVLADRRFPPSPGCALFRLADLRKNLVTDMRNRQGVDLAARGVGADLLLYLNATRDYPRFAFVNAPLSIFRAHADSITTASKQGAVPLLNALAKTWFLEQAGADEVERRRHDAYLFLLLRLFGNNTFGFRRPADFYQTARRTRPDWGYMLRIGLAYLAAMAARRAKAGKRSGAL